MTHTDLSKPDFDTTAADDTVWVRMPTQLQEYLSINHRKFC